MWALTMKRSELIVTINTLKDVQQAANWQGMFTPEIRQATFDLRLVKISHPLTELINKLEKELARIEHKRKKRRIVAPGHLPYIDD
jgi:hypothetical protein